MVLSSDDEYFVNQNGMNIQHILRWIIGDTEKTVK